MRKSFYRIVFKENDIFYPMAQDYKTYISSLKDLRTDFKLDGMKALMVFLGSPYLGYKTIHVGGTNGKGSTCAFLARILREAGCNVGLYTSPHLIRYNERIQVNGQCIDDKEIQELTQEIKKKLAEHHLNTTFFEFTTALAFLYFFRKKVDVAVIEVGLGGRLDATNVITPLVSVITNVDLEHTEILGDTVEKIASEKAGIIKQGVPVVTAEKKKSVLDVFTQYCQEKKSILHIVDPEMVTSELSLRGEHQKKNAAAALEVIRLLRQQGLEISETAIKKGFRKTTWPGRIQIVSEKPLIVVDCAHNVAGVETLVRYLSTLPQQKILLLATAVDKNSREMARLLIPLFQRVIVTEGNYRVKPGEKLAEEVLEFTSHVEIIPQCQEAVHHAYALLHEDEMLVVTGSMYMVGDVLQELQHERQNNV